VYLEVYLDVYQIICHRSKPSNSWLPCNLVRLPLTQKIMQSRGQIPARFLHAVTRRSFLDVYSPTNLSSQRVTLHPLPRDLRQRRPLPLLGRLG
jgi:hypothetical protein